MRTKEQWLKDLAAVETGAIFQSTPEEANLYLDIKSGTMKMVIDANGRRNLVPYSAGWTA